MLVLTVNPISSNIVYIGDFCKIRILSSNNGQMRVGFEAPKSINIVRGKILSEEQMQELESKIRERIEGELAYE